MLIRTGILHVPAIDDQASTAVRGLLRAQAPEAAVLLESQTADQRNQVADVLRRWSDEEELDLIVTIGGTMPSSGPSGREIVPDATADVAERALPGLGEAMRAYAQEVTELALIDRSGAAIRGRTLILNLPQGAAAASLFLEAAIGLISSVIAHLQGLDCAPSLDEAVSLGMDGPPADDASGGASASSDSRRSAWDAEEFAEFLRRRGESKEPGS